MGRSQLIHHGTSFSQPLARRCSMKAEQQALRQRIDSFLNQRWGGDFRRSVRGQNEGNGKEVVAFRGTRISLTADDFGTVLVQLRALGLIQKSDRKRSIADKGTYWTLSAVR